MKKSWSRWALPLVIVLMLVALLLPKVSRQSRAELNLFNWTEYMPQEILDAFAKEFQVKVNYDTYSSNEEMLAKLTAGAAGYDVIFPSDYMVSVLIQQDLLEPIDKKALTNWDNLDPEFLQLEFDPENRYSVPYMWGTVGIAINTDLVKEEVTRWEDLWHSAYAGNIVLPDDPREIIGMGLQVIGKSRNSIAPEDLKAAQEKLRTLMPAVKAFDSDSPKSLLLAGEVHLGMVWNGEAVLASAENPKIIYILPEEGGGIWMDTFAIPKTAKNKELALEFINFILRPEISAQLSTAFPYGNPNLASHELTDPAILANQAAYPPTEALRKAEWLTDVGEATVVYDRIWTELKGQ